MSEKTLFQEIVNPPQKALSLEDSSVRSSNELSVSIEALSEIGNLLSTSVSMEKLIIELLDSDKEVSLETIEVIQLTLDSIDERIGETNGLVSIESIDGSQGWLQVSLENFRDKINRFTQMYSVQWQRSISFFKEWRKDIEDVVVERRKVLSEAVKTFELKESKGFKESVHVGNLSGLTDIFINDKGFVDNLMLSLTADYEYVHYLFSDYFPAFLKNVKNISTAVKSSTAKNDEDFEKGVLDNLSKCKRPGSLFDEKWLTDKETYLTNQEVKIVNKKPNQSVRDDVPYNHLADIASLTYIVSNKGNIVKKLLEKSLERLIDKDSHDPRKAPILQYSDNDFKEYVEVAESYFNEISKFIKESEITIGELDDIHQSVKGLVSSQTDNLSTHNKAAVEQIVRLSNNAAKVFTTLSEAEVKRTLMVAKGLTLFLHQSVKYLR